MRNVALIALIPRVYTRVYTRGQRGLGALEKRPNPSACQANRQKNTKKTKEEMMNILDILDQEYKKVASTNGGEWAGPCPWCGGRDRFRIWPEHQGPGQGGRYLCRQCGRSGVAIQFLRDFQGTSFGDAYRTVTGQNPPNSSLARRGKQKSNSGQKTRTQGQFQPQNYVLPNRKWLDQAGDLTEKAYQSLLEYRPGLEYLKQRGFNENFIREWRFGWILEDKFYSLQRWGLEGPKNKRVWVPQGLLIPMWQCLYDSPFPDVIKIKIRRPEEERKKFNPDAKYWQIKGSYAGPVILSQSGWNHRLPCVVVESELDGLLLLQDCGDLTNIICLGSAGIKPDKKSSALLKSAQEIILATDADAAGIGAWDWWLQNFGQKSKIGMLSYKDIGEMKQSGANLREWTLQYLYKDYDFDELQEQAWQERQQYYSRLQQQILRGKAVKAA